MLFAAAASSTQEIRRVQFPHGQIGAVLKGSIVDDSMNQYLLGARVVQTMSVHITSPNKQAQFDVYPLEDRPALVNSGAEDTMDWKGQLPESGHYVVSVYSVGDDTFYTLGVTSG